MKITSSLPGPVVSVIIVTHNSAVGVGACVQSLRAAAEGLPLEVIVVDTRSTDETLRVVKKSPLPVVIMETGNRGFAAAANVGSARARGKFLLFLNPDTALPPRSLVRLIALCAQDGVAAASGLLVGRHGRPEPYGEPFPSFSWYLRRRVRFLFPASNSRLFTLSSPLPMSVPWLSGAALLVRADVFRAVGGFDERYFLYYEDIDLCRRLRQRGYALLVDPGIRILHVGGGSASRAARVRASDQAEDVYFSLYRPRWEGGALRILRPGIRYPWIFLFLLALGAGALVSLAGSAAAVAVAAAGLAVVLSAARAPDSGALLLLASVLPGQLIRVPLPGGSESITLTDVLLPLVLAGWLLAARKRIFSSTTWGFTFLLPLVAVLPGLLLAAERLSPAEWLVATGYAVRFFLMLALVPLGAFVLRRRYLVAQMIVGVAALLSMVGFVQLRLVPSLALAGFDPHQGRLFSTWLDPNLLGGFLAVALAVLLGLAESVNSRRHVIRRLALVSAGGIVLVALVLTKSRTSLAALFVAIVGAALVVRSWRRIAAVASVGVLGLVLVPGLGARFTALAFLDPTVQLRLESWRQAVQHVTDFLPFGVGYNAYAFEQIVAGNIGTLAIHSRAGADNSLLTFAATTGLWGLGILSVLLLAALWTLARRAKVQAAMAAPALLGLLALLAHAQFTHSLPYIHLAVPVALLISAAFIQRS